MPPADDAAFEPGKVQNLRFMKSVNAVDTRRDYSIIVDRSGSMAGDRWREVCFKCVAFLESVSTAPCLIAASLIVPTAL